MERKADGGYQDHQYLGELRQVAINMFAFPFPHIVLGSVAETTLHVLFPVTETDKNLAMESQKVISDRDCGRREAL